MSPVERRCFSNCLRVTPAWTVASRSSALTRRTLFIRVMSIETPPWIGLTCPSSDEPAPNGTTGQRCAAQARDDGLDGLVAVGEDDRMRQRRRVMRFAAAVMFADARVRGEVRAGDGASAPRSVR